MVLPQIPKQPVSPARWTPPPLPAPGPATPIGTLRVVDAPGYGTEDVLVDHDGRVVTGLEDGRVMAYDPTGAHWSVLGETGGRPLGVEHHPDGGLVVCDAYRGLLHLDRAGSITELTTQVDGRALRFCNNAAVAADGTIYFSDSSTKFDFTHWRGDLIEHVPTGRLLRRSPDGRIDVLLDGLAFANGVALLPDESAVVVAETGGYGLRRVALTGPDAGAVTQLCLLPGFPDNISTGEDGNVWVAIASPRDKALDALLPRHPALRKVVWSLPQRFQPQPQSLVHVQAFGPDGALVHDLVGEHPRFGKPTGVRQVGTTVWLGSFEQSTIAALELPG